MQRHLAGPVAQGPCVPFFWKSFLAKRKKQDKIAVFYLHEPFGIGEHGGAQVPLPGTLCSGHEFKPALGSVHASGHPCHDLLLGHARRRHLHLSHID